MLVFPDANLTFMAIPKTGTTALEGFLAPRADIVMRNPPEMKHMPVYRYKRFFIPLLERTGVTGLETMAIVREPIDWLGSWYKYRSRDELKGQANSTAEMSFDDFIKGYLRNKKPPFADVGSQAKFAADGDNPNGITHLFRYENMKAAIEFLNKRLAVNIVLARKNVSPPREFHLSPGVEARLRRKYEAEFTLWENARTHA